MRYLPLHTLAMAAALTTSAHAGELASPTPASASPGSAAHCYHAPHSRVATCTPGPVNPLEADAEAKRMAPHPQLFTLYVVRQRWSDVRNVVDLQVSGQRVGTVPDSYVRLRLPAGAHQLAFDWQGRRVELPVHGGAGEVRVVELAGSIWAWGARYDWVTGDEAGARARLQRCRLVADLG